MSKTYRYKNLSFPIHDIEEANFTVEFVSDGNTGPTVINVPGEWDPEILDQGTISLGKGEDLWHEKTISFSAIANPVSQEDEIRIKYKINGQLLVEHVNSKEESEHVNIILFIKFLPA